MNTKKKCITISLIVFFLVAFLAGTAFSGEKNTIEGTVTDDEVVYDIADDEDVMEEDDTIYDDDIIEDDDEMEDDDVIYDDDIIEDDDEDFTDDDDMIEDEGEE